MNHPANGWQIAIEHAMEQCFAGWLAFAGHQLGVEVGDDKILLRALDEGDAAGFYHHQIRARKRGRSGCRRCRFESRAGRLLSPPRSDPS